MSKIYASIKESLLKGMSALKRSHFTNYRKQLGYCHPYTHLIKPLVIKGAQNVYMYEDTGLKDALIMTPKAKFIMKKHSGAAEGLTVITGNHERRIGRFYRTITEQEKQLQDMDVVVEEDCWIGTRVTLLMGVTLRRGTTVAAGAVVSKSTAPYSVVGGVPAKHIKFYWSIDQIMEHEALLYPKNERYTREQLELFYQMYSK
ncbi:acyltransferase [Bacteroides thetaiotaomicron]|uniref:acyltransferase n=1 Tax=Bacteroides thetaiotaomicron TaxID=818 RepID=UPI001F3702DC|nr:acyltransferase [Bacteroides thetaiotaomicron]MCS2715186.1 acyltransferase [Bacteroides thetaiotaomicron]MCS2875483.1 acyltransferase [Bacteroides thetaiotaomicron]